MLNFTKGRNYSFAEAMERNSSKDGEEKEEGKIVELTAVTRHPTQDQSTETSTSEENAKNQHLEGKEVLKI